MRMSVGRKVAKWRATKGLSERGAAELIGVSQPTLRSVERDEYVRIGLDVALKFVRVCGLKLEDFVSAA